MCWYANGAAGLRRSSRVGWAKLTHTPDTLAAADAAAAPAGELAAAAAETK